MLQLLEGLNEPQRGRAARGEGPLLILAGAGSARPILTHRITYLIATGHAEPNRCIAVAFHEQGRGGDTRPRRARRRQVRAMWVMTFRSAGARSARRGPPLARQFHDLRPGRARPDVETLCHDLSAPTRNGSRGGDGAPKNLHAKNKLRDADAYGQMSGSLLEQTVTNVYQYESDLNAIKTTCSAAARIQRAQAVPEGPTRYANGFHHVLHQPLPDTNHAQYRWLQLIGVPEPDGC